VLNQLPVIGYECLNPTETALLPHEINLIDTGLTIQFPNAHVLKIEIYSALFSSPKVVNKYIFPHQNKDNKLIIPLITNVFTVLPKNSLLCFLRFIPIADVVTSNIKVKIILQNFFYNKHHLSSFPNSYSSFYLFQRTIPSCYFCR
jgi:hypothetical protein